MRLSEQKSDFLWMVTDLLLWARNLFNGDQYSHMKNIFLIIDKVEDLAISFLIYKDEKPICQAPLYATMGDYWESMGGVYNDRRFEYDKEKRKKWKEEGELL